MSKPKLNQPDIKISTTFNSSDKPETINMNITIPSKMFENIFITETTIQLNPTIEEVKQEWEDNQWMWKENLGYIHLNHSMTLHGIVINKLKKEWFMGTGTVPLELHNRLTKTLKALGWEV